MEDIDAVLTNLREANDSDFFVFVGSINDETADKFIEILREKKNKRTNCSLMLTTYGGDPDSGYRIMRAMKRLYEKINFYVFGSCKSTGTLMALGADEIIMCDFGEFGPLDIQLAKDDEMSNTSGLNFLQSLTALNDQMFKSFEKSFLNLKQRSNNSITTKTAAEIGSKLAVGLITPISAQIDPVKLGEVHRAMQIADHYGTRLCKDKILISKLIAGYPSHGFVIDFEESKDIFPNVRWVNDEELIFERYLSKLLRRQEADLISELLLEKEHKKEEPINNFVDLYQQETSI